MHWALAVVAVTLLAFAAISGRIAGCPVVRLLPVPKAMIGTGRVVDLRGRG